MQAFISMIKNRWFISFIGVLLVDVLIWVVGPVFLPEGVLLRAVLCGLPVLLWLTALLVVRWNARKANEALTTQLVNQGEAAAGELALLSRRMKEALDYLKKSRGTSRSQYLYQIPWYIIIGPPGSGKTTALKNSDLLFPPDTEEALRGVGGTRNCEWLFTEQAVFLDTAGRYTTQDSDSATDQAEWLGFLEIIKKNRGHQPINGVLLAIPIAEFQQLSTAERKVHSLAIRKRINELGEKLGVRPPVYVLFTKMDLVAGFVEHFDDQGKEGRSQVWGASFPFDDGQGPAVVEHLLPEFDALVKRLEERVIERIQTENDVLRRGMILGFPRQFALLRQPVQEMLNDIFLPSRYENRSLLRGFYFTSGTQLGTPIDRVMGEMASVFGLRFSAMPIFSGQGRSYFLSGLLSRLVFPEAGMTGVDRRVEQRQRRLRLATAVLSLLLLAVASGLFVTSFFGNRDLVNRVETEVKKYSLAYQQIVGTGDVTSPEWKDVLSILDMARHLPTGYEELDRSPPFSLTFGLYQGNQLQEQTVLVYHRVLSYLLLPRLLHRLEQQLHDGLAEQSHQAPRNLDLLLEALPVYTMLGKRNEINKDKVLRWYQRDFVAQFPAADQEALRQGITQHLEVLLMLDEKNLAGAEMKPFVDTDLVDQVRAALKQVPLAQRAYTLIKQSSVSLNVPQWVISDKAGPASEQVFRRLSDKPLSEGIPGLFTRNGFYSAFLPQVPDIAAEVLAEAALIDKQAGGVLNKTKLEREIFGLYYDEYSHVWNDTVLKDVSIKPFTGATHAAQSLNILQGSDSPLKKYILAVAEETLLTQPPPGMKAAVATGVKEAVASTSLAQMAKDDRLGKVMGSIGEEGSELIPGKPVEDRFKNFRRMTEGSPSQLDEIIKTLGKLYDQTIKVAAGGGQDPFAGGGGEAGHKLAAEASTMQEPFKSLLGKVAVDASGMTTDVVHKRLNDQWKANVLPFCQKAIENRYPFAKSSNVDIPMDDFGRLFSASDGLLLEFFNTQLARYVDTSQRTWKSRKVDGIELKLSSVALEQFRRAKGISERFFRGSGTFRVNFELKPIELDPSASGMVFQAGGQELAYSHGPQTPVAMQWPAPTGSSQSALYFNMSASGKGAGITKEGPWSLFRLLETGRTSSGAGPEQLLVEFHVGGRSAIVELRAGSVNSPFDMGDLRQFRCVPNL